MVSCLMFNSLSHFEFIFVHGVRVCFSFTTCSCAVFPAPLAKETFFLFIFSPPLLKINWSSGFISGFSILFHWVLCLCLYQYHTFLIIVALYIVWSLRDLCFLLCFFFPLRIAMAILGLLCFHINFWAIYSSSVNNVIGNLIEID